MQAPSIADALIASLNDLGRLKMTENMSNYPNTVALKRIYKTGKAEGVSGIGPEFQFNIITDHNHSARHVGLGYVSRPDIPNLLATGKMPFRHTHWEWAMERRLTAMNQGQARIVDEMKTQRDAALGSAILLFEQTLWTCPSLADFDLNPVGIPYFVVKSSTVPTYGAGGNRGFTGTVPSGYTLVANINPSAAGTAGVNGRWKNWAAPYVNVTKEDLIYSMQDAQNYTDFMPLVAGIPTYEVGNDYGIYARYSVVKAIEAVLEGQNENLGKDAAPMRNQAVFMRTKLTPVFQLDLDVDDPVYMINWSSMGCKYLSSEWMHETNFTSNPSQPTMMTNNTDCTWNMYCNDRRRQAVLSLGTSGSAAGEL